MADDEDFSFEGVIPRLQKVGFMAYSPNSSFCSGSNFLNFFSGICAGKGDPRVVPLSKGAR